MKILFRLYRLQNGYPYRNSAPERFKALGGIVFILLFGWNGNFQDLIILFTDMIAIGKYIKNKSSLCHNPS